MARFRPVARGVAVFLLMALPACQITFRRQPIEPLDTDRTYEIPVESTWEATREVIEGFGPEVETVEFENDAGLIVTEWQVLPDVGEPWQRLQSVAYARGARFIGGRYSLTVTVRQIRGGRSKVKVSSAIQGYLGEEYGYQTLRQTGVLEEEIFARINARLGAQPVSE